MEEELKYRIVKVFDHEDDTFYYQIEERRKFLGLIPYWGIVLFKSGDGESWICHSKEEAMKILEHYKKTKYNEIVYEE